MKVAERGIGFSNSIHLVSPLRVEMKATTALSACTNCLEWTGRNKVSANDYRPQNSSAGPCKVVHVKNFEMWACEKCPKASNNAANLKREFGINKKLVGYCVVTIKVKDCDCSIVLLPDDLHTHKYALPLFLH